MRSSSLLSLTALVFLAAPAPAGASFTVGDLYLISNDLPTVLAGIVRIDPVTGADTPLLDIVEASSSGGMMAYDPFRDRLLYLEVVGVRAVDSSGTLTTLVAAISPARIATRGDGIVYLWSATGQPLRYIDASDSVSDLLDEPGTGSYTLPAGDNVDVMLYHRPTNSLILVADTGFGPCSATNDACVLKVPLTPGGTQVDGPLGWAQVNVSDPGERPQGIGYGPGNSILFVVDTDSNDEEPRMQLLDPVTMTLSTYAQSGFFAGAAVVSAGTYSNVSGTALLFDSFNNLIRSYTLGSTGAGTTFASGLSGGGSGELARLVEIWEPVVSTPAVPSVLLVPLAAVLLALALGPLRRARKRA